MGYAHLRTLNCVDIHRPQTMILIGRERMAEQHQHLQVLQMTTHMALLQVSVC